MTADFLAFAASRHGFEEAAARARLGPFATARDLAEGGFLHADDLPALLADYEAHLGATVRLSSEAATPPAVNCGRCGRPLAFREPERQLTCDPCGVSVALAQAAEPAAFPPEVADAARDPANVYGRYVRLRELGKGGMGAVYLAHDTELARPAALKLPRFDDPDDLARLKSEALTAAALNHPNIAQVYEVGHAHGRVYLAMQYIDGESPDECTPRRAAQIVRDAARGVAAAHQRGVLHRDLKPGNLMIDRTGHTFVMDFGLAKRHAPGKKAIQSGWWARRRSWHRSRFGANRWTSAQTCTDLAPRSTHW